MVAVNTVLKVAQIVSGVTKPSDSGSSSILVKMVVAVVAVVFMLLIMFSQAPLSVWGLLTANPASMAQTSDGRAILPTNKNGTIAVPGMDNTLITPAAITHYLKEEKELEAYAKKNWSSGTGEDTYTLPDWRWLWALDCALSMNNYNLIKDNPDVYTALHRSLLVGVKRTEIETYEENVYTDKNGNAFTKNDKDVLYDSNTQTYYKIEKREIEHNYWEVSYRSFEQVLSGSAMANTPELLYFTQFESGDYGAGWGDNGNALGAYQFDRRYGLSAFLKYCYQQDPIHYSAFTPYFTNISQGNSALEKAWKAAYKLYPDEFTKLQDEYAYNTYYTQAKTIAKENGITLDGRRDCIKGLFWGIVNLFGGQGARHGLSKITLKDSMSDIEVATAICEALSKCTDFVTDWKKGSNSYAKAWAHRYKNELETIKKYLSSSPATSNNLQSSGDTAVKLYLVSNYYRVIQYIDVYKNQVVFDYKAAQDYLVSGTSITGTATEVGQKVVDAAYSQLGVPYVWAGTTPRKEGATTGGALDCSGLTQYCYKKAGITIPRNSEVQHTNGIKVPLSEVQPGDILWKPGHVGIYVGEGKYIHAPQPGKVVELRNDYKRFTEAVRYEK